MKLLLVNPNRYRTPPVPPLGLEHVASAVKRAGHDCRLLDLCFEDDPENTLAAVIDDYRPDVAGFTVRNIDTVLYLNNVFFLDDIARLTAVAKSSGVPVLLGGAGFSFSPEAVLVHLDGDWGVAGTGERAAVHLLDSLADGTPPPKGHIIDGWTAGFDPDLTVDRNHGVDYGRYYAEGGIAGFQTQKGCRERCPYCGEASTACAPREPGAVIDEIAALVDNSFDTFHLCDTEFNQDTATCTAFLEALIRSGISFSWTPYLKTSPWDGKFLDLLAESGVTMTTVSIPTGADSLEEAASLIPALKRRGIGVAVDFLCGFPGESTEQLRKSLDRLRGMEPDSVGVNGIFRLYPGLGITPAILGSPDHRRHVLGPLDDNPGLLQPVFFARLTTDELAEHIGGDPLFRIEGMDRATNYERIPGRGTGA